MIEQGQSLMISPTPLSTTMVQVTLQTRPTAAALKSGEFHDEAVEEGGYQVDNTPTTIHRFSLSHIDIVHPSTLRLLLPASLFAFRM